MLDNARTKFEVTAQRPTASGVTSLKEGAALIADTTGTEEKAKLSAGAGGEIFLGFALISQVVVDNVPKVEDLLVPTSDPDAAQTVTLAKTPAAALKVYKADGTEISAGVPNASNSVYSITGNVVTVGGLLEGLTLTFMYLYTPSYAEVQAIYKQAGINFTNQIVAYENVSYGFGPGSEVFTDQWTPTGGKFAVGTDVVLGASGLVRVGGGGTTIGKCIKVPLANDAFLGLRLA